MRIYGAKGGGGSSHTPVEAPETGRSKQMVNIVELLCEGEIEGLVDGFKSIYLDGTKVQNDDGSYNFKNVSGQLNVGTQDQTVLNGFDSSQNEVNVGVEVKKKTGAIIRTITDERVNRLRLTLGVRSLFEQNNQGDTNGTSVTLRIKIGTKTTTHTFNGKYSSQYLESVIFDNLPKVPFNISVERITNDSDSNRLQNGTIWSSYTEIIDTVFTYPNSAVAGISFDSEYFSNIPTRNYEIKAKKVKVPSNYDPINRTYTGLWDGTFKIAWTDNPAWEIYDLAPALSKMLGVEISFDKWALYDVSRYCDQLVPDGMGGQEPRFTCNVWLTEVKTAYDLLNDFCSVFRAIPVWNGTEVSFIIDRPRDPVWTYTNANVTNGFERSYSARKSRHNAVQVTYSDKNNGYESAIEYVSDDEEIKKHGLNLQQVTAFGCTSRGQAHRTGRWILETEKREKETITFTVGREGLMHLPGDIIRVADESYAGTAIGGRVLAVNGKKVTLDREITIDHASYFAYINASATHNTIKISAASGNEITLASTPTGLEAYGVWSLSTKQVTSGLYRSISIVENADGTNTITALQHEPQKEAIVDNSAHFVETATTLYKAPQINAVDVATGYDGKLYISSEVSSGDGKLTYDIKITKDGNLYQFEKGLSDPNIELSDLPNGDYSVIIYGKNTKGQIVTEKTQTFTIDRPPVPTGVVVTGGLGNITLEWDWVNEVTQTEIFAASSDNFALAEKIAKVTACTYAHTVKGNNAVQYYWLRHVRGGNVGAFYQERGVKGQTAVDLDSRLDTLNTTLSQNIVNEVFDVAMPARSLGMTKYVKNLNVNTYQGQKQVYDETSNKLYSWNGSKYILMETELLASAIKGTIQANQLATIPTSKLSGTIADSQLASVSANKLTGTVAAANLSPIPTTKLTGTLTPEQIASVPTTKLTGVITDNQIQQVNADKINGILALNKMPNIPTSKLTGFVQANQIQANAIGANHISAGAITASKMVLYGENMILDPLFTDKAYWKENMATLTNENEVSWQNGKVIVNIQNKSVTNGTYLYGLRTRLNFPLDRGRTYRLQCRIKVTGDDSISNLHTSAYIVSFPNTISQTMTVGGLSIANTAKYGARDELVSCSSANYRESDNQIGVYLRIGCRNAGDIITNATVEFSELELIKMSDSELIVDGAISANKIQTGAIESDKIKTNAITAVKIDTDAIEVRHIKTNAIESRHIAAAQISAEKMQANSIGANAIQAGVIGAKHLATDSVTAKSIKANSIGTNHIATNSLNADRLLAGSIEGGKIKAGAIATSHLQAGAISTDKLAVGLGGNLLQNPIFANPTDGRPHNWNYGSYANFTITAKNIINNHTWLSEQVYYDNENLAQYTVDTTNSSTQDNNRAVWLGQRTVPVVAGKTYMFSAYVSAHRLNAKLYVDAITPEGKATKSWQSNFADTQKTMRYSLKNADRLFIKFTVPDNANTVNLYIMGYKNGSYPNSMLFVMRPMLEECTEYTTQPSAWVNAGVTSIHGGSIVTNTVTAQQIAANTITANEIAAGTIAARNMAVNSINAEHIVSRSITVDKLNVANLSAINSNLGTVTAGTISGITITGNTITGGSITGTTITGGIITGTTINGVTGTFSGKIYAENLIDDTAQAFTLEHNKPLTIPAFGKKRILFIPYGNFTLYTGYSSSSSQSVNVEATVSITSSAGGTIKRSSSIQGGNKKEAFFISGFLVIPANITATINYTSKVSGNGSISCDDIPVIAIC